MVNSELAFELLKKVHIPTMIRTGMGLSFLIFKGFDIEGRVNRWIYESQKRSYK